MTKVRSNTLFDPADRRIEAVRIASERAVSELRYGRPVLVNVNGAARRVAVLALDCAGPDDVARFLGTEPGRASLFLTAHRARALGLSTLRDVALGVGTGDFDHLSHLAFAPGTRVAAEWRPAPEWSCLADLARLALLLPVFLCRPAGVADPALAGCLALD